MRTTFAIWCHGDTGTMCGDQVATVEMDIPEDNPDFLIFIKKTLVEAFSDIWGETAFIMSETEFDEDHTVLPELYDRILAAKRKH